MYSTGHGSVVASPNGSQLYYVHHGRPSTTSPRAIYTSAMRVGDGLTMRSSTSDEPLPPGVGPIAVRTTDRLLRTVAGRPVSTTAHVRSAPGAEFDLANPLNRVRATLWPAGAGTVAVDGNRVTVTPNRRGLTMVTVVYQRELAAGGYRDVANTRPHLSVPVRVTIPVVSR
jgi:hypothetical protein